MDYYLHTIKDIFDKVPADRIKTCLDELAIAMQQAKAMEKLLELSMSEVSGQKVEGIVRWPETSVWVDDGNGTIDMRYVDQDGVPLFSHHVQLTSEAKK